MTPGQAAYAADLAACPHYHDGAPRPAWDGLSDIARWSWERDPRPREWVQRVAKFHAAAAKARG